MPNIAVVLKDEIRRLARKEVKTHLSKTRRATVRYRSDIAQLKRLVKLQERKLAVIEARQGKQPAAQAAPEEVASGARFSARSVRAQRKRLKLSAEQYAKLIGVSPQSVYLWERGEVRPKRTQFAALISARSLGRREALARLSRAGKKAKKKVAKKARPARRPRRK
jgi:DNA-binding transcriptional regulator YiaG